MPYLGGQQLEPAGGLLMCNSMLRYCTSIILARFLGAGAGAPRGSLARCLLVSSSG